MQRREGPTSRRQQHDVPEPELTGQESSVTTQSSKNYYGLPFKPSRRVVRMLRNARSPLLLISVVSICTSLAVLEAVPGGRLSIGGIPLMKSISKLYKPTIQPHVGYKKVLVTGGAGFIGSHVAEKLLERGDDVVIIDEMNDYYDVAKKEANLRLLRNKYQDESRLVIYKGDICDKTFIADVFEKENFEWVCHMAARAGVRPSIEDPYVYIHSNVRGTTQLMDLSVQHKIKNFVFASSSSVYGGSESTYFSESENVDHPISPYAASKKSCELLSYTYHHLYKLNVTALRFFTVYGPRGRPDMAPFIFVDRVSRGLEIQQFGDGSTSRDYTYITDIVDGVIRSIDRQHPYEIFNLGKGNGTPLREFIDLVQKYTGKRAKIRVMPEQPGDVPYTCADVTKAHDKLDYKARVPFEEGIRRTVEWYTATYINKTEEEI